MRNRPRISTGRSTARCRTARTGVFVAIISGIVLAAPAWAAQSECDRASQRGDWPTALLSCELQAQDGDASAQFTLGTMYFRGQGVSVNTTEAARWYRRSAERGNIIAQTELGVMYAAGIGVPKDYVLAHMWLDLAASAPNGGRRAAAKRTIIERSMLPVEIAEARKRAKAWKVRRGGYR